MSLIEKMSFHFGRVLATVLLSIPNLVALTRCSVACQK